MNESKPPKTGAEAMPAFKMGFRVIPDYDKQTLTFEQHIPMYDKTTVAIRSHVLDLKDVAVRTLLIFLGWTPPPEPPPAFKDGAFEGKTKCKHGTNFRYECPECLEESETLS
jgi:hypothetical protein